MFKPLHAMLSGRLAYLDARGLVAPGARVLDVGCGGGYLSEALAQRGAVVTGVDVSEGALDAARAHREDLQISYVLAQGEDLPFQDSGFDGAVCTDVLVHAADPAAVLREIGRVLRPGGWLYVSSIVAGWLPTLVLVTLGEGLGWVHRGTHDPARFLSVQVLRAQLEHGGLELVHHVGLGPVGWGPLGMRFGAWTHPRLMVQGLARRR